MIMERHVIVKLEIELRMMFYIEHGTACLNFYSYPIIALFLGPRGDLSNPF